MRTVWLDDITHHYSETLRRWREDFVAHAAEAERLGYDLRFRRMWALYLAYVEAGFTERRIGDVQMLLGQARVARRAARAGVQRGRPVAEEPSVARLAAEHPVRDLVE